MPVHRGQRRTSGILMYHFLLHSFETGLSLNLELGKQRERPKNPERKVQVPGKKRLL